MGRTLCFVLLLSASVYLGSADKCDDKYPECGIMAADGGCEKDFVKEDCPTSCHAEGCGKKVLKDNFYGALPGEGLCSRKSVSTAQNDHNEECENTCPECIKWAADGECGRDYVWEQCRLACDPLCNSTCIDVCPEACQAWGEEGHCDDPWVYKRCQKTCNKNCWTTARPPTTIPTTPIDCTDDCIPACQEWFADKSWDMCANPRFAAVCPAECDARCKPDPTTTGPIPDGTCDDLCTDSMGQFAIPGAPTKWCHCSNWLGYVKDCPKCTKMQGHPLCEKYGQKEVFDPSKGQCDWPEIACKSRSDCPYTAVEQVVAVKREYADCKFWAANGDCFTGANCGTCDWQKWVCNNCPSECSKYGDCHSANKPTPPTPTDDKYADCKFWAANGDCHDGSNCGTCDWQHWVAANCPTSCANN